MSKYNVYLWTGAGYFLTPFENIEADCEEKALDKAVVIAEQQNNKSIFFDELDEETRQEMEEGGQILYIDATLSGANEPHFIDCQNLKIEEV